MTEKYIPIGGKLRNITDRKGTIANASNIAIGDTDVESALKDIKDTISKNEVNKVIDVDHGSLNSSVTPGTFRFDATNDAPTDENSGILEVSQLDDEEKYIKQVWLTNGETAIRTGQATDTIIKRNSNFYVKLLNSSNGSITTYTNNNAEIRLAPGKTYELSGYLNGHIIVTTEGLSAKDYTKIYLNGVTINSDRETAILYTPEDGRLVIDVGPYDNYIYACPEKMENGSESTILSNDKLLIIGVGNLYLKNNYNESHGIKAPKVEIDIADTAHLDIQSNHDGIHGSSSLTIGGGNIIIHDLPQSAIESKNSDSTKGKLRIYHGNITIRNCKYGLCAAKSGKIEGLDTTITFENNADKFEPIRTEFSSAMEILDTVKITGADIPSEMIRNKLTWFGEPRVLASTPDGVDQEVTPVIQDDGNKLYTFTSQNQITLKGYFQNCKFAFNYQKTNVILDGAYVEDSSTDYILNYIPQKSRINFKNSENIDETGVSEPTDTTNYFVNNYSGIDDAFGIVESSNNIAINMDTPIITKVNVISGNSDNCVVLKGSKITLRGDGLKYLDNPGVSVKGTELYIGADDEDYTNNPIDVGNADQIIYANEFYSRISSKGAKGTLRIYNKNRGDIYINNIFAITSIQNEIGTLLGSEVDTNRGRAYITGKATVTEANTDVTKSQNFVKYSPIIYNPVFPESGDTVLHGIIGDWTVLKNSENLIKDTKLQELLKKNSLQVFDNIDLATTAAASMDYGTTIAVKSDDTSKYGMDYDLYIVVQKDGSKDLKKIEGSGSGSSGANNVSLTVTGIYVGSDTTNHVNDATIQVNSGATIRITYEFESALNPDVAGNVYLSAGGIVNINPVRIIPNGSSNTWNFDTGAYGLSAGIYRFSIYGKDVSGAISSRTTFTVELGGLEISSSFTSGTVVNASNDLRIPISIITSNPDKEMHPHIRIDGTEIHLDTSVVTTDTSGIMIPSKNITDGTHSIEVYVTNEAKESNHLNFSIIAAQLGKIYALTDEESYIAAEGTRLSIGIRTIELGYETGKFHGVLQVLDSNKNVVQLYGKDTNEYSFEYGLNLLQIIGLASGTEKVKNAAGETVDGKAYALKLTVSSDDDPSAAPIELTIPVAITSNNYNIQPSTDGLVCWFDAAGKMNQSSDREIWENKAAGDSAKSVPVTFGNFNWSSNGWLPDNDGNTALTLNSGAYVELDLAPFANEVQDMTISIDFETEDVLDAEAKVVSCLKETPGTELTTYYLRDPWGDYVARNTIANPSTDVSFNNKTEFDDETNDDEGKITKEDAIKYILAQITNVNENAQKQAELAKMTDAEVLAEWKLAKFKGVDNVIKYFIHCGGYCWVNGVTYNSVDTSVPYDVTYTSLSSDKVINLNAGDADPAYDGDSGGTHYAKFTGQHSSEVTKQVGFYIDTQYGVLSNSTSQPKAEDKFHMNFSQGTRTRMDFVITRASGNNDAASTPKAPYYVSCMAGYVNGVISGIQAIGTNDQFSQGSDKYKIYLGCKGTVDDHGNLTISDTGACKIYSFRIYNKALDHTTILRNYASEIPDFETKRAFIDNNGIIDPNSLAKLPRLCLVGREMDIGGGKTRSTINDFIMQLASINDSQISDLKSMKEPAYITYTDPSDTSKSWVAADGSEYIPVRLQFQGTSSMVYPMKNYKFKMYASDKLSGNDIIKEDTEVTNEVTGVTTKYKKNKYKKDLHGVGIDENTFCIKVNYMDSSEARNTGTANFVADCSDITGKTPAMELDPNIRTTVYGYPILIYYKDNKDSKEERFLGVGDLNLDKSCTDSFGLDDEVKDNDTTNKTKLDFGKSIYMFDDAPGEFGEDILKRTKVTVNTKDIKSTNTQGIYKVLGVETTDANITKTNYYLISASVDTVTPATVEAYEAINLYDADENSFKWYIALRNNHNKIVAAVSEKGYLRTVTNQKVSNVACFELKANSGAGGAGGFGNYDINSVGTDLEPRYPDDGDIEDDEYTPYNTDCEKSISNRTLIKSDIDKLTFKEYKSPYYYHFQRLIKWIKNSSAEEFKTNIDKHFNRNYLIDYYLTVLLLGGVDSLGKNLMVGTWGPENRLYLFDDTAKNPDGTSAVEGENKVSNVITFTRKDGSEIRVTPNKVKIKTDKLKDGSITEYKYDYQFAKDSDDTYLFYDENKYSKYNKTGSIIITTKPGECIWYPMFYDIDTILGVDNAGKLLYDVDIEIYDKLSDGTVVFNTSDSELWTRVNDVFGAADVNGISDLSNRWQTLRQSKFTYDNLVGKFYYGDIISKIPAAYYNQDCFTKYVYEGPRAPGTEYTAADGRKVIQGRGSGSYLYCCHGDSYEHIKKWVKERLYYLDSMFGMVGRDAAQFRCNYYMSDSSYDDSDNFYGNDWNSISYSNVAARHPDDYRCEKDPDTGTETLINTHTGTSVVPIRMSFKTYQPGYVGVRWRNGGKIHFARVGRNETKDIIGNTVSASDTEVFIYGGSNIKEIGDLSPYNIKSILFAALDKLTILQIGSTENASVITDISSIGKDDRLTQLILTNCGSLTTVNVSDCKNLKYVDMTNSGVTNITLPTNGGALESITYSNNITSIDLENFTNLTTIVAPSLNNLNTFKVINCPKVLGSRTSENATVWNLLQQTNNTKALDTIQVQSYGTIGPKILPSGDPYFFMDHYYTSNGTRDIRGVINYTGTVVPEHYTEFAGNYPYLTINYTNITDGSEMFASYKNIPAIGTLSVYAGSDIYGNKNYQQVYYWKDETPELQTKWHNSAMYTKYGYDTTYTTNTKYYKLNENTFYRMIGIYDEEDLDMVRAEIKSALSAFHKFTNINGMFKNMPILDYLDPDTFNGIDISTATTDEMFSGDVNLEYFELPNDNVKNEPELEYRNYDENDSIGTVVDKSSWDGKVAPKPTGRYVHAVTGEIVDSPISTYKKGMRNIGANMFFNCKKLKLFVKPYDSDKIHFDTSALAYNIYSQENTSNYTFERPVVLFDVNPKNILVTTTEAKSTYGAEVSYDNPKVDGEDNLYYALDNSGYKRIDTANKYFEFSNSIWLREVYFNVDSITRDDTSLVDGLTIDYATRSDGKRIIFKVERAIDSNGNESTTTIQSFNFNNSKVYSNPLKIYSVTAGALEHIPCSNPKATYTIELPVPKYDNLDPTHPTTQEELSIVNLFTRAAYKLDSLANILPNNLVNFYIDDTKVIEPNVFTNNEDITLIGLSGTTEELGNYSLSGMKSLVEIRYGKGERLSDSTVDNLRKIGDYAFFNDSKLALFCVPGKVTEMGIHMFDSCASLNNIQFYNKFKVLPEYTFANDRALASCIGLSKELTTIGTGAFYLCTLFHIINQYGGISLVAGDDNTEDFNRTDNLDYFSNLETIGDYAFYDTADFFDRDKENVINPTDPSQNRIHNIKLSFPSSLKYIGQSAFGTSNGIAQVSYVEIVWNGNYDTDFIELSIGDGAFGNMKTAWRPTADADVIDSVIAIPKLAYIGKAAFKIPGGNSVSFNYALTKNSKEELDAMGTSSEWVTPTNKIIYQYYGIYDDPSTQSPYRYLLSSAETDPNGSITFNGEAYIQNIRELKSGEGLSTNVTIPAYISPTEYTKFKVVEILTNAFNKMQSIGGLTFAEGSQLRLIEKGVLRSGTVQNLQYITTTKNGEILNDVIPETLKIETGNELHDTAWLNSKRTDESNRGKFITLGKNILAYVPVSTDDFTLDLTDNQVKNCDTVFDSAFAGMSNLTGVKFGENITAIYSNSFSGTGLTSIEFPSKLTRIDDNAFFGCHFKELRFPASLKTIGAGAFKEYSDTTKNRGALQLVDFANDAVTTGTLFTLQEDKNTGVEGSGILPKTVNSTLHTLHVPAGMPTVMTNSFTQLRLMSQITHLYLGSLKINDDKTDSEHYGTYLIRNCPLYIDSITGKEVYHDGDYTGDDKPSVNSEGKQIYVPQFYRDLSNKTIGFKDSTMLHTTEEYWVYPLGDFFGNIILYYIQPYPSGSAVETGTTITTDSFTELDLITLLAGFTTDTSKGINTIELRSSDMVWIRPYIALLSQTGRNFEFKVVTQF